VVGGRGVFIGGQGAKREGDGWMGKRLYSLIESGISLRDLLYALIRHGEAVLLAGTRSSYIRIFAIVIMYDSLGYRLFIRHTWVRLLARTYTVP
jgi:hypothetical protein